MTDSVPGRPGRPDGEADPAPLEASPAVDSPAVAEDSAAETQAAPESAKGAAHRSAPSLGRASALMASGTLVSRVLGLVRNSLLAAVVATSLAADAFQVANTLPNMLFQLLNAGVLNAVLIPQITKAMQRGREGEEFVDRLLTVAFGLIAVLAIVGTVASPWLVPLMQAKGGATLHLTILFAWICVPQIIFYGVYAVLGNVLNARNQFAAFMWAPALANVVQIIGLVAFWTQWGRQDDPAAWTGAMIWTLAGSMTLSIAAQALVLVVPLVRGGFRWRPRLGLRGSGLGDASRMVGWTLAALLIAQLGGVLTGWVLTGIVPSAPQDPDAPAVGGLMSYTNAMAIFLLPHGLVTVSILTALFPQMSRTWQAGDRRGMRRLMTRALSTPAVAVIPASAAMIALAGPLVDALLGLDAHSAAPVARALQIMAVGTLGYGISTLQQRYSFAREEGRQNFAYQLFLTGIQVSFALIALWAVPPRLGLPMVALGLVVGNWAVSALFLAVARRQLDGLGLARVARLWIRLLVAAAFAAVVAALVVHGLWRPGDSRVASLLVCAVAGTLFAVDFWLAARILRIREVDEVVAPVLRRLPVRRR